MLMLKARPFVSGFYNFAMAQKSNTCLGCFYRPDLRWRFTATEEPQLRPEEEHRPHGIPRCWIWGTEFVMDARSENILRLVKGFATWVLKIRCLRDFRAPNRTKVFHLDGPEAIERRSYIEVDIVDALVRPV